MAQGIQVAAAGHMVRSGEDTARTALVAAVAAEADTGPAAVRTGLAVVRIVLPQAGRCTALAGLWLEGTAADAVRRDHSAAAGPAEDIARTDYLAAAVVVVVALQVAARSHHIAAAAAAVGCGRRTARGEAAGPADTAGPQRVDDIGSGLGLAGSLLRRTGPVVVELVDVVIVVDTAAVVVVEDIGRTGLGLDLMALVAAGHCRSMQAGSLCEMLSICVVRWWVVGGGCQVTRPAGRLANCWAR